MKINVYDRSTVMYAAMQLIPPIIRNTLYGDEEFCRENNIKSDAILSLDNSNISIQRSKLFNAVRKILAGKTTTRVKDTEGHVWNLEREDNIDGILRLVLIRGDQSILLLDMSSLSPHRSIRLQSFEKYALRVNLPQDARSKWHNLLSERSLEDNEVDKFHNEIIDTPVENAKMIYESIHNGKISILTLTPSSRKYYERLVGMYDGSPSIHDYAINSAKSLFFKLKSWNPYDGFLYSLLVASHPALTPEIDVNHMSDEQLYNALDYIERKGDRVSQMGAIEVGLRVLSERPQIEPLLIQLIEQIRDDDVNDQSSSFRLLAALFVLVDGELSRTKLFSSGPSFYRRLVSLTQTSLICRQFILLGYNSQKLEDWVHSQRGEQFYLQSLSELRLEPRWHPLFVEAQMIKEKFFGRIINAAKVHEKNIKKSKLFDIILSANKNSLILMHDIITANMPGPLESSTKSAISMPTEISKIIETKLSEDEIDPTYYLALINSALIFQVGDDKAELAAKALKHSNHQLNNLKNTEQLIGIVHGLARLAAITRSQILANEVRILLRNYMNDKTYSITGQEALSIGLVAAASHTTLTDWCEFVGNIFIELAYGAWSKEDAISIHSHLKCLCQIVPELWYYCGHVDAALMGYIGSGH